MKLSTLFNYSGDLNKVYHKSYFAHELGHAVAQIKTGLAVECLLQFSSDKSQGASCTAEVRTGEVVVGRGACEIAMAGAVFQTLWLYDQGVMFKPGKGFNYFWRCSSKLEKDRAVFEQFCGDTGLGKYQLSQQIFKQYTQLYKELGGRAWVKQMASKLQETQEGVWLAKCTAVDIRAVLTADSAVA